MNKDSEFMGLLNEQGPPTQLIWLRASTCSKTVIQKSLAPTLPLEMERLSEGKPWHEICANQSVIS